MSSAQSDLFASSAPARAPCDEAVVKIVRARLHAALALVRGATAFPWPDMLAVTREDNAFRYGKDLLPPEEGAALWAEFDAEMDRLFAIHNDGREMPPD